MKFINKFARKKLTYLSYLSYEIDFAFLFILLLIFL